MHLPSEIVIFGRAYDLRDLDQVHRSEGILGLAAFRDAAIYLDDGMDPHLSLSTLWHEAVHIAQQELLGAPDEEQARWISLFVHNFLMQNPAIVECYLDWLDLFSLDEEEYGERPD